MSVKAVGILAHKIVPLNIIQGVLKRFPQHYLYLINPSFEFIEQMHQNNVDSSNSMGPDKYKVLTRLCYF